MVSFHQNMSGMFFVSVFAPANWPFCPLCQRWGCLWSWRDWDRVCPSSHSCHLFSCKRWQPHQIKRCVCEIKKHTVIQRTGGWWSVLLVLFPVTSLATRTYQEREEASYRRHWMNYFIWLFLGWCTLLYIMQEELYLAAW